LNTKKIQPQCLLLNKKDNQELAIKWTRELANTLLNEDFFKIISV
jgi:hypothetical protein